MKTIASPLRLPLRETRDFGTSRLWQRIRRALSLLGIGAVLLFLCYAISRDIGHADSEPVAYKVWMAPSAITASPAIVVASTADEWQMLWMKAGRTAPPFDATQATGVGIFLGERAGRMPMVHIVGASQRGQRLVVTYEEILRSGALSDTPQPAAPWAIVTVGRTGLPVSVEERIRD